MSGVFGGNCRTVNLITVTFDPASVAANTTAEQTMAVPGVRLGDYVAVVKPTLSAGLAIETARVSASDVVTVTISNNTASPIDAGSEAYLVLIIRPEQPGATSTSQI